MAHHLVMYMRRCIFGDSGEEGRIEGQTSVPSIEPGPSDWESSALRTKPLLRLSPHSSLCGC